jgi:hypothetical protein
MAPVDGIPMRDEVRRILAAAADVIFSDGVSDAFLDQWADETVFMLSLQTSRQVSPVPRVRRTESAHARRTEA